MTYIPVCSPRLLEKYGPVKNAQALARLPLIHDESLSARGASPNWSEWFKAAGVDDVDFRRGLRFNSADHALDAAGEGAGVLLTHDILAYDDLRNGRLVIPVKFALPSGRTFSLVWAKGRKPTPAAESFRRWIKAKKPTRWTGKGSESSGANLTFARDLAASGCQCRNWTTGTRTFAVETGQDAQLDAAVYDRCLPPKL